MYNNESTSSVGLADDKEWAKKYLLEPLIGPDPNQETGPGSSFKRQPQGLSTIKPRDTPSFSGFATPQQHNTSNTFSSLPTPPASASPKTTSFSLSSFLRRASLRQRSERRPVVLQKVGRSRSADSKSSPVTSALDKPKTTYTNLPTPVTSPTTTRYPPNTSQTRSYGGHHNLAGPSRNTDGGFGGKQRMSSQRSPSPNPFQPGHRYTSSGPGPYRIADYGASPSAGLRKSNSTNTRRPTPRPPAPATSSNSLSPSTAATTGIHRNRSLSERYAGDMSHRPLAMIKRDVRAADRSPHMGGRRYRNTDQIDILDNATVGGPYHHGGPYDAASASRNVNPMYSPLEAVRVSNEEALKATPREFVQDSLEKHVPLQGTAIVPAGERSFGGQLMQYEEGADLMREADAPGGAYGRWPGQIYLPEDLKGKGEPSYTIEKAEKEKKEQRRLYKDFNAKHDIEMETGIDGKNRAVMVRQRSVSSAAAEPRTTMPMVNGGSIGISTANDESGLHRSNSTGKHLSDGIKRRFGSIRRKGRISAADMHSDD